MVVRQTRYANAELMKEMLNDLESTAMPMYENTLSNSNIDAKRRSLCTYSRFGTQIEIISLKYTLGHELDLIQPDCELLAVYLENHLDARVNPLDRGFGQYSLIMWGLSLCYLFNIDLSDELIDKVPFLGQDMLLDRLIHCFRRSHYPTHEIIFFVSLYEPLLGALGSYEKEERNMLFLSYLNGYLKGLKYYDASWFDSHKESDPSRFYHFGYWAFELAALVVDINWDDSELRDNPLYPKDLVDWKRAHKE